MSLDILSEPVVFKAFLATKGCYLAESVHFQIASTSIRAKTSMNRKEYSQLEIARQRKLRKTTKIVNPRNKSPYISFVSGINLNATLFIDTCKKKKQDATSNCGTIRD